jgi:hypothetical protein
MEKITKKLENQKIQKKIFPMFISFVRWRFGVLAFGVWRLAFLF